MSGLPHQYPGDLVVNGYHDPNQQDFFYPSGFQQHALHAQASMSIPPFDPHHLQSYPQHTNAIAGPSYAQHPVAPPPGSVPQMHGAPAYNTAQWQSSWEEENTDYKDQDVMYAALEVKHRRRTSPEQLKVLEYWFDVNPKPDTQVREMLAAQLGMTKRNVQVWFQNRRAKVKGIAIKAERSAAAKAAAESQGQGSPPGDSTSATRESPSSSGSTPHKPPQVIIPPVTGVPMARRASLANGEAAKIESFIVKHRLQARKAMMNAARPGLVSPLRSPKTSMRKTSNPYPSSADGPLSPKGSPAIRPMSSALHLTALRNNTRKEVAGATVAPGGQVQLISSATFTPPRVVSGSQLGSIPDQNEQQIPSDFSAMGQMPYDAPANGGPLPNPGFSFGSSATSTGPMILTDEQAAMFMNMQNRGRLGSMASVNTYGTAEGSEWSELTGMFTDPDGFDPDARRASAPADLLHELGILGINNPYGNLIRPSPLGNNFPAEGTDLLGASILDLGGQRTSPGQAGASSIPSQLEVPSQSQSSSGLASAASLSTSVSPYPSSSSTNFSIPPASYSSISSSLPNDHSLRVEGHTDEFSFFDLGQREPGTSYPSS